MKYDSVAALAVLSVMLIILAAVLVGAIAYLVAYLVLSLLLVIAAFAAIPVAAGYIAPLFRRKQ